MTRNNTIQFQGRALTFEEAAAMLEKLSREGLAKKYGSVTPELAARVAREVAYITASGELLQRFLLLWDLARYAREHRIFIGPGFGTLPGSLTAYCLDVTGVDPIRNGLLFERLTARADSQLPLHLALQVPERSIQALSAYLADAYPGENAADLLSCDRTVSQIDCALQLIEESAGTRPDLPSIDFGDKNVLDLLTADGERTFCVFKQGSPFLKEIQPRTLEELTAAAAFQARGSLLEPDTAYQFSYLEAAEHPESLNAVPRCMMDILKDTRGCLVYTEQLMRFFAEFAGYTLEQAADHIRSLKRLKPQPSESAEVTCLTPLLRFTEDRQIYLVYPLLGRELPLMAGPGWEIRFLQPDAPLMSGAARWVVGKSHFLPIAVLSYWAAYLCRYYPSAYQRACSAFPVPDLSKFPH